MASMLEKTLRLLLCFIESNSLLIFQIMQRGVTFMFAILLPGLIGLFEYGRFSLLMVSTTSIAFVFSEATSIMLVRYLSLEDKAELNVFFLYLVAKMMFIGGIVSAVIAFSIGHSESSEFSGVLFLVCCLFSAALVANSSVVGISYGLNIGKKIGFFGMGAQICIMVLVIGAASYFSDGAKVFIIYTVSVVVFSMLFVTCFLRSRCFEIIPLPVGGRVKVYAYIYTVMAGMLLCAPVHLFCIAILASTKNGIQAVGVFNALFVWYSIITMLPGLIAPKLMVIFSSARVGEEKKWFQTVGGLVLIAVFFLGTIAALIYIVIIYIFSSYISFFDNGASVVGLALTAGVVSAACSTVTYWLYSRGFSSAVLKANIVYAALYLLGVSFLYYSRVLNVTNMLAIIVFSSFMQFLFVFLIAKKLESKNDG